MSTLNVFFFGYNTDDARAHVEENLRLDVARRYHGGLDDASTDELAAMAATAGAQSVPVETPDGGFLDIDYAALDKRSRVKMDAVAAETGEPVLMFCTAPWDAAEGADRAIMPFRMLEHMALALRGGDGVIGVFQPWAETAGLEIEHWQALGPVVSKIVEEDLPAPDFAAAAAAMVDQGATVLVLDCLAYTQAHYDAARSAVDVPIVLPATALAALLNTTTI